MGFPNRRQMLAISKALATVPPVFARTFALLVLNSGGKLGDRGAEFLNQRPSTHPLLVVNAMLRTTI
jgi:hypothetical protein